MNEEPNVVEEPVAEAAPGAEKSIVDELARLGKQVADGVKAAWESEDRRKIQSDVTEGLQKFGQEISDAFEKAAESEQAKEVRTKTVKLADEVAKSDVVGEVRKGILTGLDAVNRELGKLLERLESKPGAETPVEGAPVVNEPPAEPKSEM